MHGTDHRDATPTRRRRPSERRTATIDAFIDLMLETGSNPKPEAVAARAEVSIASLYRYFDNLDELRRDAFNRVLDRFSDLFQLPDVGTGPREGRIDVLVATRVAFHEKLHPLQLLSRSASRSAVDVAGHIDNSRRAAADQISLHFAPELDALDLGTRTGVVSSINVLTSVESWEVFRRSHGRTSDQTCLAWIQAIDQLLPPTEEPR